MAKDIIIRWKDEVINLKKKPAALTCGDRVFFFDDIKAFVYKVPGIFRMRFCLIAYDDIVDFGLYEDGSDTRCTKLFIEATVTNCTAPTAMIKFIDNGSHSKEGSFYKERLAEAQACIEKMQEICDAR